MKISVYDLGKRFHNDWIFRKLNFEFHPGSSYAITGKNGAGKSTLLQILAGAVIPSEGSAKFTTAQGKTIPQELVYQQISFTAPYLDLIEEMTATEFLAFHANFKPLLLNFSSLEILEKVGLANARNKQIRYFSSGMKQRLKLAQAIFSESKCLFLDEPCTNLDDQGYSLYQSLIEEFHHNRMILVSSNDPREYNFTATRLLMNMETREWQVL